MADDTFANNYSHHMSAEQGTDIVRSYMTITSGLKKSSSSPEQSGAESAKGFERVSKFSVHYWLTVMSNTFKNIEI